MGDTGDLAERVFAAIEAGDRTTIEQLWADDIAVWHNHDRVEQTKEQNLATLGWLVANTASRSYDEVRRVETPDGFVQQHVLRLSFADGRSGEIPACIVAEVADGRVTRIDEYFDSAQIDAIFPAD